MRPPNAMFLTMDIWMFVLLWMTLLVLPLNAIPPDDNDADDYVGGDLKKNIHVLEYQKAVSLTLQLRAYERSLKSEMNTFRSATKLMSARIFNDIVIEYNEDHQEIGYLWQIKHIEETKLRTLKFNDLMKSSGSFFLPKYILSFLNTHSNFRYLDDQQYILFSNIHIDVNSFEEKELKLIDVAHEHDSVVLLNDPDCLKSSKPSYYKLDIVDNENFFNSALGKKLLSTDNAVLLANKIQSSCIIPNDPTKRSKLKQLQMKFIVQQFIDVLSHEIFHTEVEIITPARKGKKVKSIYHLKLSEKFLNRNKTLSDFTLRVYDNLFSQDNVETTPSETNPLRTAEYYASGPILKLVHEKSDTKLPYATADWLKNERAPTSTEIDLFFKKFVLCPDQPTFDELANFQEKSLQVMVSSKRKHSFLRGFLQIKESQWWSNPTGQWWTEETFKTHLFEYHKLFIRDMDFDKQYRVDHINFEVDSVNLQNYIDNTMNLDPTKSIPIAKFETSRVFYAYNQISNVLDVNHENFMIPLDENFNNYVDFIKPSLKTPTTLSTPRTLCFIARSSYQYDKRHKSQWRDQLKEIVDLLKEPNKAVTRVIFVLEKPDPDIQVQSVRNMVDDMIRTNKLIPNNDNVITDGTYTLKRENMISILHDESFIVNGRTATLQQIYGNVVLDPMDFKPGLETLLSVMKHDTQINEPVPDVSNEYPGGVYIKRKYEPQLPNKRHLYSSQDDTPTAIAENIVRSITVEGLPSMTILHANSGDGRTTALKKIQFELQRLMPYGQSILVDVEKLYPTMKFINDMSLTDIIRRHVKPKSLDLFNNVLKINPKQIVFIFDGVSEMLGERETKIMNIIDAVKKSSVSMIITAGSRTTELLRIKYSDSISYDIPEMNLGETAEFLTSLWKKKILEETAENSELSPAIVDERLKEYVTSFTKTLLETSFIRQPLSLTMLGEMFDEKSSLKSVSCSEYVLNNCDYMSPSILIDDIELVAINKNALYNRVLETINYDCFDELKTPYGVAALEQIVHNTEESEVAKDMMRTLRRQLNSVHKLFKNPRISNPFADYNTETIETSNKIMFHHEDFRNFFAATCVVELFDDNELINTWKKLLANIDYHGMLEFINYQVEFLSPMKPTLFKTHSINDERYDIIMTIGSLGLDNLYFFLHNAIIANAPKEGLTKSYLYDAITTIELQRRFGVIVNMPKYYPAQNPLEPNLNTDITCTPVYLFVRNAMVSSLRALKDSGLWFTSNIKGYDLYYDNLMYGAVTRPAPNLELIGFLIDNSPDPVNTIRLSRLLLYTIDELPDERYEPVVKFLIQRGAKPTSPALLGITPLHTAVKSSNLQLVKCFIKKLGITENSWTSNGRSVLAVAFDASSATHANRIAWWQIINLLFEKLNDDVGPSRERPRLDLNACLPHRFRRSTANSVHCYVSWDDVNRFNDAVERRSLDRIRVSSDKYLNALAVAEYSNPRKAYQLVDLVRQLDYGSGDMEFLTGPSKLLVGDIVQHGSLRGYWQQKRTIQAVNDIWRPSLLDVKSTPPSRINSRAIALHAASVIPLLRGLHATIATCLQQHNETNDDSCLISSTVLGVSTALMPISHYTVKYTPWMVDRFTRTVLELLPSTAPRFLAKNLKFFRSLGIKYDAKIVGYGFEILSTGFDLYNIVEMSKMINTCHVDPNAVGCTTKEYNEYVISLSFSCISIVMTATLIIITASFGLSLLIGLGLMVIEIFVLDINEVIYFKNHYNTNFDENARIFFHKISFQPQPQDIQALANRTELINHLEEYANHILETSHESVVAYGIGVDTSYIDMTTDDKYTKGLSRFLPKTRGNTTMLCLPQRDTNQVYDKSSNTVRSAKYRCRNAFVVAHKERWQSQTEGKSTIIFDLRLIKAGEIIGSPTLNNKFLIDSGRASIYVPESKGNTSSMFVVFSDKFRGSLHLSHTTQQHILDLSAIKSPKLFFDWNSHLHVGTNRFSDNDNDDAFQLISTPDEPSPNLYIIGRANKPDSVRCDYHGYHLSAGHESTMTVDSGGGESLSNMDYVIDCRMSIIKPFTNIVGSDAINVIYTAYLGLQSLSLKSSNSIRNTVHASIKPRQSQFIVIFTDRPLLNSIVSVTYIPKAHSLNLKLLYTETTTMDLTIEPYHSHISISQKNTDNSSINTVSCILIDKYSEATIFPTIRNVDNKTSTIVVQYFDLYAVVNSTKLDDVISRYRDIIVGAYDDDERFIVTKLIYPKTGETFRFGSRASEQFYIDVNTTFIFGNGGSDVYIFNSESPRYVWLDNEADDEALDTIVIHDNTCETLTAKRGAPTQFRCCDSSFFDVTLMCSVGTAKSTRLNVILRGYHIEPRFRHLQIYWQNASYLLLPIHWTHRYQVLGNTDMNNASIELALFLSFGGQWKTSTLTLTSFNTYVVLNVTNNATNPLVAYKSPRFNDIVITRKYLDQDSAALIVLQDFFTNDSSTDDGPISKEWKNFVLFIVDDDTDINDDEPIALTVDDLVHLVVRSFLDYTSHDDLENGDLFKEYFVNITNYDDNNPFIIDHNNSPNSKERGEHLGVLIISGAEPEELHADWDRSDKTALSISTRQGRRIIVKNWCRSIRHRLYRMEFISTLGRRPIVIKHLDQLECQAANPDQLIKQLNDKFVAAQKRMKLMKTIGNDDNARLLLCITSIFVDRINSSGPAYRVLGFASTIDQTCYVMDNCNSLLTSANIQKLSYVDIQNYLNNLVEIFKLGDDKPTEDEQQLILQIHELLQDFNDDYWQNFISSLYNSAVKQ